MTPEPSPEPQEDEIRPELARLPPGRHGLPREFVSHNQRERLIAGLAEAVAKKGFAGATITDITGEAAVSRRTFYEHFANKDECFLAAFDVVGEQLLDRVYATAREQASWPEGVRACLDAILRYLAAEPSLARLLMVEGLFAGPVIYDRYREAVSSLIPLFKQGREISAKAAELPETTEEALVGGVAGLINRRILAGEAESLPGLLSDLVRFVLAPYMGAVEAEREAMLPA